MRLVIQRVRSASVEVAGRHVASIGSGLVALVGFAAQENPAQLGRMARRLISLRMFDDERGRLNRSVAEISGSVLLIPQITLTASLDKGTRPSFHTAAAPQIALERFEAFVQDVRAVHPQVHAGVFQAQMIVHLSNDCPVTFILD